MKISHALTGLTLIGLNLAGLSVAQATTTISLTLGGSSALQGDFRTGSFAQGAIPQLIERLNTIANYKVNPGEDDKFGLIALANVTAVSTAGPSVTETISDALVRYIKVGANNYRAIILLRSDSGQGVRYVANRMRITSLGTARRVFRGAATPFAVTGFSAAFTGTSTPTGTDQPSTVTQDDVNVLSDLTGQLPITITTGATDLSADSIARYGNTAAGSPSQANFNLNIPGLANLQPNPLPVLTLLPLYNNSIHTLTGTNFPVNVTRDQVFKILTGQPIQKVDVDGNVTSSTSLTWNVIDPRFASASLPNGVPIAAAYREKTSGTRNASVTLLLRKSLSLFFVENAFGRITSPASANPQNGTGAMLNTLNANPAIPANGVQFGYAFVTGTAGNSRANIRVAQFNGVAAYRRNPVSDTVPITGGDSISLPNNNTQPSYDAGVTNGTYYTETANGRYDLWTQGLFLTIPGFTAQFDTATDLASSLNPDDADTAGKLIVDALGFVRLAQMQVTRVGFNSPITGEFVTDGQSITYDLAGDVVIVATGIIN